MDFSIPEEVLRNGVQVFPYVLGDRPVWVKKRRRPDSMILWWLQRQLYRVTGMLLVMPPDRPCRDNVRVETERLRRARDLGLRVPDVLYQSERYFVMSDAGQHLDAYLRERPERRTELIERAAAELRLLHDRGLAHGGAQIKNLTVKDDEIHFIDFEESIPEARLPQFQLRDLFLFLLSLERTGHDPDLRRLCEVYGRERGGEVLAWVVKALRQLRVLRFFNAGVFSWLSMRDIRGICSLVDKADKEHAETI